MDKGVYIFGRETAKGFKKHDLKEFWHFGQEVTDETQYLKNMKKYKM